MTPNPLNRITGHSRVWTTRLASTVYAAIWLLGAVADAAPPAGDPPAWSIEETPDGLRVREGDAEVLGYQRAPKSRDGRHERANYIHPLRGLDGELLTEDFPDDHRHHRGIFWAWHQVRVGEQSLGDGWACVDFRWDVVEAAAEVERETVVLRTKVLWSSPQLLDETRAPRPVVEERGLVRIHRATAQQRSLDFTVTLRALVDDLWIGGSDDEKGYGGFSARVRLPRGVRFRGATGDVEPQLTAVEAGSWVDVLEPPDTTGAQRGVTILCHSGNPGAPQSWILRAERSMQNAAYPGRAPVRLARDEPWTLRYRLVVHRGAPDAATIEGWRREYERE